MFLARTALLAEELKKGKVTEKQKMEYLLVGSILILLPYGTFLNQTQADWIGYVCMLLITGFSIPLLFSANNTGDGKDFVARYFCISLPIVLKILFFYLIVLIPILALVPMTEETTSWVINLTGLAVEAWVIYRIYVWLRYISGAVKMKPGLF